MVQRKSFLLRLPPELMDELQKWSRDDLRSLNSQIEYLLRDAIRRRRRSSIAAGEPDETGDVEQENVEQKKDD